MFFGCRFLLQQSLLKEQDLMPGHTKAGEFEKSLHELSPQQLDFLQQLNFHFRGLYFLL